MNGMFLPQMRPNGTEPCNVVRGPKGVCVHAYC